MRYLTIKHLAERFEVSQGTIRRLIERGQIPAVRLGRVFRIPAEAVERLYGEGTSPSEEPEA